MAAEHPSETDPGIYLFNGRLRDNQSTHFAVLDIPVGDKDLQQCADAMMRLRAESFPKLSFRSAELFH